jgi:hypothetical protein
VEDVGGRHDPGGFVTAVAGDVDVEVVPDTPGPVVDEGPLFGTEQPAEPPRPTVEFCGRRFPLRPQGVSLLALMRFAQAAKVQQQRRDAGDPDAGSEMDGLIDLYVLIRSCIDPAVWDEFEQHGIDEGAGAPELMAVIRDASQAAANRPTSLPTGSPGGRSTTAPSSAAGSSSLDTSPSAVVHRLEQRGRPDIGWAVQQAQQAQRG